MTTDRIDAAKGSESGGCTDPGRETTRPSAGGYPPITGPAGGASGALDGVTSDGTRRDLWVPDNPDGSGWAPIDWASTAQGSRYHYRHGEPLEVARATAPPFYRIVTRLESETLAPHENSYYVPRDRLADFLAEISLAGGAELVWHVEPCTHPPPESGVV